MIDYIDRVLVPYQESKWILPFAKPPKLFLVLDDYNAHKSESTIAYFALRRIEILLIPGGDHQARQPRPDALRLPGQVQREGQRAQAQAHLAPQRAQDGHAVQRQLPVRGRLRRRPARQVPVPVRESQRPGRVPQHAVEAVRGVSEAGGAAALRELDAE